MRLGGGLSAQRLLKGCMLILMTVMVILYCGNPMYAGEQQALKELLAGQLQQEITPTQAKEKSGQDRPKANDINTANKIKQPRHNDANTREVVSKENVDRRSLEIKAFLDSQLQPDDIEKIKQQAKKYRAAIESEPLPKGTVRRVVVRDTEPEVVNVKAGYTTLICFPHPVKLEDVVLGAALFEIQTYKQENNCLAIFPTTMFASTNLIVSNGSVFYQFFLTENSYPKDRKVPVFDFRVDVVPETSSGKAEEVEGLKKDLLYSLFTGKPANPSIQVGYKHVEDTEGKKQRQKSRMDSEELQEYLYAQAKDPIPLYGVRFPKEICSSLTVVPGYVATSTDKDFCYFIVRTKPALRKTGERYELY